MQIVKEHFSTILEVKQSKFIAHLIPYDLYDKNLQELKTEHPKARHFVTASRHLNEFSQIVEHSSDNGEPKGTSGKPSLMVLQGKDLINVAVIIVRYFGGTKLGTGGLVRAYSDAVNLVVESANVVEYQQEIKETILFSYSDIRLVDHECEAYNITVVEKEFADKALYLIQASKESMELFLEKLNRVVVIKPNAKNEIGM